MKLKSMPKITSVITLTVLSAVLIACNGQEREGDMNGAQGVEAEESKSIEVDVVDSDVNGSHNDADVIDGTDQEEHVSTY